MKIEEDAPTHEFQKYPFGSVRRLFAAYFELTGIDMLKQSEGEK